MKYFVSILAITTVLGAAAQAAEMKTACARGEDERVIEIVMPGEVGKTCDVRYVRGDETRVPYHADNSQAFCEQKAKELMAELTGSGFSCAAVDTLDVAEADAPSDYVVEARLAQEPEEEPAQAAVSPQPANMEAPAAEAADELDAEMNEILAEPQQPEPAKQAASSAPANLMEQPKKAAAEASAQAPAATVAATQGEQEPALEGAAPVTPASATAPGLRKPEEVIRATLNAQAAAWNEGNLDAFMETYWKDDKLKFVSGSDVTKGWSATLKHYRETYGGETGFGLLGFEKMDVQQVTDDIAVVTGRFNLTKDGQATGGVFTLVMQNMNGVWRIVHDHTNVDTTTAQ